MKTAQLCFEINGGGCKNKVSARNGFVCAAGHDKGNGVARPTSISKMNQGGRKDLATSTEDEATQWELFRTEDFWVQYGLAENPSICEDIQLELFRAGNPSVQWHLALNPSICEDIQLELFRAGDSGVQQALARNPSIDESLQLELFRTGDKSVQGRLAENHSICEDLQWELFRTGDRGVQFNLAKNPSIGEAVQLELFSAGDRGVQWGLAYNSSIGEDIAIELAKAGEAPFGYLKNKSIAELIQPENIALLNQYPEAFGQAYLDRLLNNTQDDKEESKALTLHSYLVYEKSGGIHVGHYKNEILNRYAGDQEVALIISTEPAQ